MVLLPITTQHASFRGSSLSIAVVVDGAEEAQAQFPCSSDAATTYLVAEKGARYRVLLELVNARARSHRARSSTVLTCALFVDGAKVASRILRSNAKTELRGVFHAPTNSVARFQFSPPVIVAEGGLQEARHLAKLGTIQVRVYLEHFVGFAATTTALRRDMLVKPSVVGMLFYIR
ncbi:hypothetical protein BC830DRAFT_1175029 [Chytriomyces sp. MP71]|nr:hypothetical protein BC830DRAFT_1175029 [Chytriomyces sp. MP71]